MTNVVNLAEKQQPVDSTDLIDRFHNWYSKQDNLTKDAIREIVNRGKKPDQDAAKQVIQFLNLKTQRNYRPTGAVREIIEARLRSGVDVQEMKAVIAVKAREWLDDEVMNKYLRPKTLFNRTNFENYLGEINHDAFQK